MLRIVRQNFRQLMEPPGRAVTINDGFLLWEVVIFFINIGKLHRHFSTRPDVPTHLLVLLRGCDHQIYLIPTKFSRT